MRFRHIYREANRCTDFLARFGSLLENDFIIFTSPLVDLFFFREVDANGTGCVLNLCLLFSVL